MKKLIVFVCSLALLGLNDLSAASSSAADTPEEGVKVWCSPDLHILVKASLDAYRESHPEVKLQLEILEGKDPEAWNNGPEDLMLVTKYYMDAIEPGQSKVRVIGREVYVPVMNPENPFLGEIMKSGISPEDFARLYSEREGHNWGSVLNNGSDTPVRSYRASDPSFIRYFSEFTESDQSLLGGTLRNSCREVIDAVKSDRLGVGFCTLSQLKEMENSGGIDALAMIPVDINNNGRVDHFEEIYGSADELHRGIWIGKYSGHLYSRIYAVLSEEAGSSVSDVLKWMVSDGQEFLAMNGYSPLLENEREALLTGLERADQNIAGQDETTSSSNAALIFIAVLLAVGIVVFIVLLFFNDRSIAAEGAYDVDRPVFVAESSEVPGGYYFDRSHTWTYVEKDGNIRVGLDNFIQKLTGTISRVEMMSPGEEIRKGQNVFTLVQNGKRLNIKSPVSGIIRTKNSMLADDSSLINSSPFSEGWLYIVEPFQWQEETETYLKGQKYREWITAEFSRLKDFLAGLGEPAKNKIIVMQDGGEVHDGVLENLGPKVWEDFQSDFLKN